jgi:hypothetical protein
MSEMPGNEADERVREAAAPPADASRAAAHAAASRAAASPLPSLHAPGAEQAHVTLLVERLARMEAMLAELRAELRQRGGAERAG